MATGGGGWINPDVLQNLNVEQVKRLQEQFIIFKKERTSGVFWFLVFSIILLIRKGELFSFNVVFYLSISCYVLYRFFIWFSNILFLMLLKSSDLIYTLPTPILSIIVTSWPQLIGLITTIIGGLISILMTNWLF